MIVLLGESGSGKSTIEKEIVNKYNFKKIVTYTTRPKREKEIDGIDYHFISNDEFNNKIASNFFVETACYNGWYYGTAINDCSEDSVIVLTPHGFRQLKNLHNCINIVSFYINTNRRARLIKILERGDDIEEAYRRNLSDVGQFDGIKDEVDYVIYNLYYGVSPSNLASTIVQYHNMCKK